VAIYNEKLRGLGGRGCDGTIVLSYFTMRPLRSPWSNFRRVELFEIRIGSATRLRIAVKKPDAGHEV
jgi:hypothetical protein